MSCDLNNFNLNNEHNKITEDFFEEVSEEIKNVNVSSTIDEAQNSSLQNAYHKEFSNSININEQTTTPENQQNLLGTIQELEDRLDGSAIDERCYVDVQKLANESNYSEMHSPFSQNEVNYPMNDEYVTKVMQSENVNASSDINIVGENEKSFFQINNETKTINKDNAKFTFETPPLFKNDDNCIISSNELRENVLIDVPKSEREILHCTNPIIFSKSEKNFPVEIIPTGNTQLQSSFLEIPERIIIKGRRRISGKTKNKEQTSGAGLEMSTENFCKEEISTETENSFNTVIDNTTSLNERKVLLAEQSPLKTGDTESEASFSENSSSQELTADRHGTTSPSTVHEKDETVASIKDFNNLLGCEENKMTEKCIINPEIEHNQHDPEMNSSVSLNPDIESDSKSPIFTHPRNKLTRLWKDEKSKIFEIFPKHRNSVLRKISHLEKELRTNNQVVHKLPAIDIKKKKFLLQASNDDENFSCNLEVTCDYQDPDREENTGRRIRSWVQSVSSTTSNESSKRFENSGVLIEVSKDKSNYIFNGSSCNFTPKTNFKEVDGGSGNSFIEYKDATSYISKQSFENISEEDLNKPRTPLTGSSEDPNFHFHASTSPSDRSSDISEKSEEFRTYMMHFRHQSSPCFSTNEGSSECLQTHKNEHVSQDKKNGGITDSYVEFSGGIKWVSEISSDKSPKITDRYSEMYDNSSKASTSKEFFDSRNASSYNETPAKNACENSEKLNQSDTMFHNNDDVSNGMSKCFNNKYMNKMISGAYFSPSEGFLTSPDNYEANPNSFQETNRTDPLKYHLKYKNLDLHVLDSSPHVTIRLVDEKDDSNPTLTPKWQGFVSNSLSSSNSSIQELLLPSTLSSCSSGETVKEDLEISEGELKMQVRKNYFENASTSSEVPKTFKSKKTLNETTVDEIHAMRGDDTLTTSQNYTENASKINQNSDETTLSVSSQLDEAGNSVSRKHAINESVKNDICTTDKNSELVLNETKILANTLLEEDNNFTKEYFAENEILETDTDNSHKNTELCEENEKQLIETEAADRENEGSKDFQFEAKGVKLTCKQSSESDSVEVKFRQLEDKTTLTFKSGFKKLYLKMAPKV